MNFEQKIGKFLNVIYRLSRLTLKSHALADVTLALKSHAKVTCSGRKFTAL